MEDNGALANKITILLVGDFQFGSGLTNYMVNTYQYFDSASYAVDCLSYTTATDLTSVIDKRGWGFYQVTPITTNPLKHFADWKVFLKKYGAKYDVVHFNYSASWNFYAINAVKKYTNAQVILHSHNTYYSKKPRNFIEKAILNGLNTCGRYVIKNKSSLNLAVSQKAGDWMFLAETPVVLQKNGIEIEKFTFDKEMRQILRQDLAISEESTIVGFVGTLEDRKNPDFALETFAKLLEKNPTAKLLLFGQGPEKERLMGKVQILAIEQSVLFMGLRDNLNEWYSAMDIFLFPSKSEGCPFVMIETQVNGLPVVCSNAIPQEAIQTASVNTLSLQDMNSWVDALATNQPLTKRIASSQVNESIIDQNGFSIKETSVELQRLIDGVVSEK